MISGSHANKENHGGNRGGEVISINFHIHKFARWRSYNPFGICWMHLMVSSPSLFIFLIFMAETRYHHHFLTTAAQHIHIHRPFTGESLSIILFINFNFLILLSLRAIYDIGKKVPICLCGKCFALNMTIATLHSHALSPLLPLFPLFQALSPLPDPNHRLHSNEIVIIRRFNINKFLSLTSIVIRY